MSLVACRLAIGIAVALTLAGAPLLLLHSKEAAPPVEASTGTADSSVIADFTLPIAGGGNWSLRTHGGKQATVVVFLGTQCPLNNAYLPTLVELHKAYHEKGVAFVGVNANPQDTLKDTADHARKHALPFPVLKDAGQKVLEQFAAERTPEAFLLDATGTVRYRGRIDDQMGIGFRRPKPTRRDLADALDEVLAGKQVSVSRTDAPGCLITRLPKPRSGATITYSKHVAAILQKNCVECHRPGQIGPMPLLTYDDAASWSAMIGEVVRERRMPPWFADPKHGTFANDRSLSTSDRQTVLAWIEQGCAEGDPADLPKPAEFPEGWRIGKPDATFSIAQQKVPAEAPRGIRYRYLIVPTNFKEDMWVQAAEARPGNWAVVHHILVYVRAPGKPLVGDRADGIGDNLLVAYAPGDQPTRFPDGVGYKIPKGSFLVFQMHYTPTGKEETDVSSVGMIFSRHEPQHAARTRAIAQNRFSIPPGADNYKVTSQTTFSKDAVLLNLFPHMHLRGKSFEYQIVFPDGKRETLLSVPKYDFNWQNNYRLAKPIPMPAGTRIECTAYFDNSAGNKNNPDPTKTVRWGEQTWDEMMIGFVDYYYTGK